MASPLPRGTCLQFASWRSTGHYSRLDTQKRNRRYVMEAYGFWKVTEGGTESTAAAEGYGAAHTSRRVNVDARRVGAVRLPREALRAAANHGGLGSLLNALQLLVLAAAVLNRQPGGPRGVHQPSCLAALRQPPLAHPPFSQPSPPSSLPSSHPDTHPARSPTGSRPHQSNRNLHIPCSRTTQSHR